MTRTEAEERARRLQAEHADRATHRFVARRSPAGGWEVVRVALATLGQGPLTPTLGPTSQPLPRDDPRTGNERRMPGLPGGIG
jgi:hypothetical protein